MTYAGNTLWLLLRQSELAVQGTPLDDCSMSFSSILVFLLQKFCMESSYDDKVACQMILDKMGLKGHQVGKAGGKAYEEEGRYEKAMEEFNSKLNGNGELKPAESGKSHFEVHDEAEQEVFLVVLLWE
ncbi:unnamed protein product [Camellia sinensis]